MHILLIDDDVELCQLMTRFLRNEGFQVTSAHDGDSGLQAINDTPFDLVVLDIMMPKKNGMDVLRELRRNISGNPNLPVIMMTARGEEMDRIIGLELGADDYLPKPCNPRELAARIRAVLRRSEVQPLRMNKEVRRFGSLEWHPQSRTVFEQGTAIELTATEYNILACLMQHAGEVVSKYNLSKMALGKQLGPFDRSLDVHIGHLRKKIADSASHEPRIKTIRSVGWLFTPK